MGHRPATLILSVIAAGFFFAPAIARLVGERAHPFENRPLAKFPSLNEGWDTFPTLTRWTTDHLPLRSNAVRLNTRISERIFGEAPGLASATGPVGLGQAGSLPGGREGGGPSQAGPDSPVVRGTNGWLYLTEEFRLACEPEIGIAEIRRGIVRLEGLLRSSGRRLVVAVPPDKGTFEGANVPRDYPRLACAEQAHRRRSTAIRTLGVDGYVDLEAALAAHRGAGPPIYLPDDTHWNQAGAVVYAKSLARKLDPRLLENTKTVHLPDVQYVGDLGKLAGDPKERAVPAWELQREGLLEPRVETDRIYPGGTLDRWRRQPKRGGARLYPGRTVLYGDSFNGVSFDKVVRFFADVTRPPQVGLAADAGHQPEAERLLISLIVKSKTLIYERAERAFWGFGDTNILRPAFLDRIERALAQP